MGDEKLTPEQMVPEGGILEAVIMLVTFLTPEGEQAMAQRMFGGTELTYRGMLSIAQAHLAEYLREADG